MVNRYRAIGQLSSSRPIYYKGDSKSIIMLLAMVMQDLIASTGSSLSSSTLFLHASPPLSICNNEVL